jgi:branched-subunit amino acid transport protein
MSLLTLILFLAAGTYLMRLLPLMILGRVPLPPRFREWLRLVPGAILATSLFQALLLQDEKLALTWRNAHLLAAIPTLLVAWRTRNMLLTILCGIASYALLQYLII